MTPTASSEHFDTCLGCMACETACPSGVRYAPLIEQTRAAIEAHHTRSVGRALVPAVAVQHAALSVAPAAARAAAAASSARCAAGRLLAAAAGTAAPLSSLAPDVDARLGAARYAGAHARLRRAAAARRARHRLRAARLLRPRERGHRPRAGGRGLRGAAPRAQGCCGALALHAGRARAGTRRSRATLIATFERANVDLVVVNAAGCGSTMKEYGHLLRDDPAWAARAEAFSRKVRDVTRGPRAAGPARARAAPGRSCVSPITTPVTSRTRRASAAAARPAGGDPRPHASCRSPRRHLLRQRRHLQPDAAGHGRTARAPEGGAHRRLAPDLVVTSNPGCILQIQSAAREAGHRSVLHVVELLDASIRGAPCPELCRLPFACPAPYQLIGNGSSDRDLRHDPSRRHPGRGCHLLGHRQAAGRRAARRVRRAFHRGRLAGLESARHRVLRAGQEPDIPARAAGRVRLDPPQGHRRRGRRPGPPAARRRRRRSSPSSARPGCSTCSRSCRPRPRRTWR